MKLDETKSSKLALPPSSMQWWRDAKFGMFLHWGLYSILGRGEWAMWNERIPMREYRKLANQFNPQKFDPRAWAETARAAGMKYMVLTAKHHDGFCLFDSQVSDFTSAKSAARRDLVGEYVQACREAGLGVGLYYSPLDWRYPGFFFPDLYRESAEEMKQQTYDQVRELLSNYGKIDVFWFDGGEDDWLGFGGIEFVDGQWRSRDTRWPQQKHYPGKPFWEGDKLVAMMRSLQPDVVINNRSGWTGDFITPERKVGEFNTQRAWETCDCLADSWGYIPNSRMRSLRNILHLLIQVITGDGNLLLNVGPTADGEIEPRQVDRLAQVGRWLQEYGHTLYGTRGGPFETQPWGGFTHKGNRIYAHIIDWPEDTITIPAMPQRVLRVRSLTSNEVILEKPNGELKLRVPDADRQAIDTIIELELDAEL
ncbi:MAG: alpha-L-fucosidase [Anaerolineae bacterium]|nr:alpha-L-fucosidase [Anaerolineae bacterium]